MFSPRFPAALAAFLLLALGNVSAQAQKLAPGLWQYSMASKATGGQVDDAMAQMQAQLAAMPPDKRKMMEDMMAQRGMHIGGPGQPTTLQVCLTPEQAARDHFPDDGRCTRSAVQRSGNKLHFKFSCRGTPPSTGEGEFTLASPHAYSGHMTVNTGDARVSKMEMQMNGKWLGADCGSVKPRS